MECMKAEAADGGRVARPARGSAAIEGVFPILCTPYCEDGSLDCETLAKEAGFVADCGAQGVIWPPANDALARLDTNELRAGWEAMACALDGPEFEARAHLSFGSFSTRKHYRPANYLIIIYIFDARPCERSSKLVDF